MLKPSTSPSTKKERNEKKNKTVFLILPKIGVRKKKEMDKKSRNPMDIKVDIRKESEKKGKEVEEEKKSRKDFCVR